MKKMIALVLSSLILCMSAGCAAAEVETNVSQAPESSASAADILGLPSAPAESSEEQEDVSTAVNKLLDEYKFEGVFYAVKGGEVVVSEARGKLENGNDIKIDTPMPIGSISKQFCATSILLVLFLLPLKEFFTVVNFMVQQIFQLTIPLMLVTWKTRYSR